MKRILFIINPQSGVDRKKVLSDDISQNLDLRQFHFEVVYTRYPKHGIALAKKAANDGFDIVVAVGGDGSVNDVINGIYGSEAALAIVPLGSGNGLARSLNIPLRVRKAIRLINTSKTVEIDLGKANGNWFASNAGVGFDAAVIERFAKSKKRGFKSYSKIINRQLWSYRPQPVIVNIDGHVIREKIFMLTVANAMQLGYGFKIAPLASLQDGYFDIVILRKFPRALAFLIALKAFQGKILKSRYVTCLRGEKIIINDPGLRKFQYDGEVHECVTEVDITIQPRALKVVVAG